MMINKVQNEKRISLKWKWAIGTGVGAFLIFGLFSFFIFRSLSGSLYKAELEQVKTTVSQVQQKLQKEEHIDQGTAKRLNDNLNRDKNAYRDNLLGTLNQKDLVVGIYGVDKKPVFLNHKMPIKTKFSNRLEFKRNKIKSNKVIVGQVPLFNSEHQLIGHVQVVNLLSDFNRNYNRLVILFIVTSILFFILISIFGYIITSIWLRPINAINSTMHALEDDPQTDARVPEIKTKDELAELGQEFNKMIDRMQRYIDQQRQFVEDVSHELRTPVAVVEGHLKMLERWGKDDPEVLEESIDASLEETQRMKNLVNEMLDLTRADQIEINYPNEETNVKQLVHQVFNDFQMIHPDFNFLLDDDIYGEPKANIYRNHLEQVLVILMDNAVKYSKERREIHVSASRTTQTVEIAIQDFGEGISAENLKQVFNRFYRVDKARSREQGGNGLGLSIAKKLIEEYHGNITLESSVGSGSVFKVELPIIESDQTHNLEY